MSIIERHAGKVELIQNSVRGFYAQRKKVRIYHGSTNSTRSVTIDRENMVDTSNLDEIIEINVQEQYAIVESNVMLDKLAEATLKLGLIPSVVSEFPGISIGGAVQGGAGESSSFRWGCVHEICTEYEVILANGDVVVTSEDNQPDLFHGLPCSYGTIGIITRIKLRLVRATQTVQLDYRKVESYDEALSLISAATKTSAEFIDAIMFAPNKGVVMVGNFTPDTKQPRKTFHRLTDEWFYIHAEQVVANQGSYREAIPIKDYLFRYDRGAFWIGKSGFALYRFPFNRFTRLWLAGLMKTRTMYRYLHGANLSQQFLIQDICLPQANTHEFLSYLDKNCAIYPLWLCPLKPDSKSMLAPNYLKTDLVINVGVWGAFSKEYNNFVDENRKMEAFIATLGGRKVLYAHTYYSRENFWENYSRRDYEELRARYQAPTIFPEIYDKVVVTKKLSPSLIKGWLGLMKSPF